MKSFKIAIGVLVTLGLLAGIAGCMGGKQADNAQLKKVKTVEAAVDNITIYTELAGNIKAKEEAGVVPVYPGIVREIMVAPGDYVNKGDVLFVLENGNLKNEYRQSQSAVVEAIESYEESKKAYERCKPLYDAGGISKSEIESLSSKVRVAGAEVDRTKAAAEILRNQVEGTSVKAPISGTVVLKNINIGDYAPDSSVAMQIADLSALVAELGVSEELIGKLKPEQEISFEVPAAGIELKGKVDSINPVMDMSTHLYMAKFTLVGPNSAAKPGMLVKTRLTVTEKKGIIVLPNQAILSDKGLNYVYCINDGKVKKTLVETGIADDRRTEIIKGLQEGQAVAVEGLGFLTDGERVEIVK